MARRMEKGNRHRAMPLVLLYRDPDQDPFLPDPPYQLLEIAFAAVEAPITVFRVEREAGEIAKPVVDDLVDLPVTHKLPDIGALCCCVGWFLFR